MRRRGERGQTVLLMIAVLTVIFVIAAIVVDFGLWLAERGSVQHAADFAALAGSQDLPLDDSEAVANAFEWAERNGYEDGVNGVEVTVELLCQNTFPDPPAGICTNANPTGGASACQAGAGCDSLRVIIRKPAGRLFTSIFGVGEVHVASGAAAGLDIYAQPVDAMVLLDATFSMGRPPLCDATQANDGCPIKEARDGAHAFTDILLGRGGPTRVGYSPYRGCYEPRVYANCVTAADVLSLTDDDAALHSGIAATDAVGGSGTNVCLALLKARGVLEAGGGQAGDLRRFVVILADGDNIYNVNAYGEGQPPPECAPSDPATSDDYIGTECFPRQTRERELDGKTYAMANDLKAQGVSIYVVGLGVCGSDDGLTASDAGYCNGIGDTTHDDAASQRLLKCIVSSPSQYHSVTSAQELGDIFQLIAWEIVGRGLVQ